MRRRPLSLPEIAEYRTTSLEQLRRQALAGHSTAGVRRALADLDDDEAVELARLAAERADTAASVHAQGEAIAAGVQARITAMIAALAPPEAP